MLVDRKLKRCFREGDKANERHKGLRKIPVDEERVKGHLTKSIHNFKAMISFRKNNFSDWSVSAGFYSLYHLLLAICAKEGIESRNQSCTFAFIEKMIEDGKLTLNKDDLHEIFDKDISEDIEHSDKILDLRENWQYSTKTSLEDKEFIEFKSRVKDLFDKLRNDLEL